jgi:hypothetical protein
VAQFFWRRYGVNLLALSALQAVGGTSFSGMLARESVRTRAFACLGRAEREERCIRDWHLSINVNIPKSVENSCECYVVYEDVAVFAAMLDGQLGIGLEGFDPHGHDPRQPFLDVAVVYYDEETGHDDAEVLFFEGPSLKPVARAPLPGGLAGKPLQDYQRVRAEEAQLSQWRQERLATFDMDFGGTDRDALRRGIQSFKNFKKRQEECIRKGRHAHLRLVKALHKWRPKIVERQTALTRVVEQRKAGEQRLADKQEAYTPLMAQIWDALPHMSVLPTGVDVQITPFRDTALGQVGLRVQRPAFRAGGEARQIEFRDVLLHEPGFRTLQDAANSVFGGPGFGRNWIFPVGYVGLAKLAQGASAHDRAMDMETLATDFWCLVRPQAAARIREKGLQDWWSHNGHEGRATDAFFELMCFLASVCIPRGEKTEDFIHGIIQISAAGRTTRNGASVDRVVWRFNPEVARLITGARREQPYYMVVNSQAMFAYEKKELHLAPALQLYLEYRTRAAYFKGNLRGTGGDLVTPDGDGVSFTTLAERLGLPAGRRPSETVARLKAALDTVAKRGVVADWRQTGASRHNPLETQVAIRMSPDYLALYDRARLRREEQEHRRFLEAPFVAGRQRKGGRAA